MPRLNYGTLLENIVVLETTRLGLDRSSADVPIGFATAFAMPSLTECWCKPAEQASNPWFSYASLQSSSAGQHPPESLQRFWSLCLRNAPRLGARPFHQRDGLLVYPSAGPNGALLAAMLAAERRRQIHLWVNDNAERYGKAVPRPIAEGAGPGTLGDAATLLGLNAAEGTSTETLGWFPDTISRLDDWIRDGPGRNALVRVGFLDPDNYAEGTTQVSSYDHRQWLRALGAGSQTVLSAVFSGCQNRGPRNASRNQRLVSFHGDEVALYPRSLVFEHGNFQTGVKIRWPEDTIDEVALDLQRRVQAGWRGWHASLSALTVHVDGLSAD